MTRQGERGTDRRARSISKHRSQMTNLEEARTNWLREQPAFGEFAARLRDVLRVEVRRAGILAEVTSRAKEMDSLIKKLIRKPEHTYESLGDKAGLRVIVRYKHEIAPVLQLAEKVFARGEPENTSDRLKPDTLD